jgi:hypothetical protein
MYPARIPKIISYSWDRASLDIKLHISQRDASNIQSLLQLVLYMFRACLPIFRSIGKVNAVFVHILLYQMAAVVLYSFLLMLWYWYTSLAFYVSYAPEDGQASPKYIEH